MQHELCRWDTWVLKRLLHVVGPHFPEQRFLSKHWGRTRLLLQVLLGDAVPATPDSPREANPSLLVLSDLYSSLAQLP